MNNRPGDSSPERILVALDASSQGRAAIEAAAALAADLRAELQGLFVENIDLIRLAGLPFATEVGYASPLLRRLDRNALERTLQAQAEELRRALADAAARVRVQSSFQVTRGQTVQATLAAAAECNLLIVGLEGRAPKPSAGVRRTARSRLRASTFVAFDGAPAAEVALTTAARLAAESGGDLVVLAVAPDIGLAQPVRQRAADLLRALHVKSSLHDVVVADAKGLVKAMRKHHCNALVINRDNFLLTGDALEFLVNELDCPLVVAR